MVDKERIRQKIQFIREGLRKLEVIKGYDYRQFQTEPFVADACLRNMQVVIEALIDIGNHLVARKGYGLPKTYGDVIRLLVNHGILEKNKENTYIQMVKFRNRIVHIYDDVSMEEVYHVLQDNLPDFEAFVTSILRHVYNCE